MRRLGMVRFGKRSFLDNGKRYALKEVSLLLREANNRQN
jgi:hypothetical protein